MKKVIGLDLDSTVADFPASSSFDPKYPIKDQIYKMYEPDFFVNLNPVPGALSGVRALIRMGYDVQILTRPVAESPISYTEKVQWVALWFPELINNINMTQNKALFRCDYLIDDDAEMWKEIFEATGGKFVHFDYDCADHENQWERIVHYFRLAQEIK